jgi:co-chaperonin GroES (HSP10)
MTPATAEVNALEVLRPTGYRILVRIPHLDAKMQSGLYRPDSSRSLEETATCMAEVLAIGEAAYKDPEKFPNGPWCEVGDTVIMRQYSGTRFNVDGVEHRLINDDTVEGIVYDSSRVERI